VDISPFPLKDFERWDKRTGPLPDKVRMLKGLVTEATSLANFQFDAEPARDALPTLEEEIAPLAKDQKKGVSILVTHCPPYGSNLDKMMLGKHVGSVAVREFIEATQPAISLHGHIHESPLMTGSYRDQLGATVSVNPGQDPYKGTVCYVTFDTDNPGETLEHFVER
jgi:Icc-related predicted phosphoesterase